MTDDEKPFVCSSSGCNMSFSNEDQLTVHKKKHDMMLNLGSGSKSAGFVADQTPTPTRFIRNCEEVGLFQDLQNVNPFEETFRRAVESGNTGTLSVQEAGMTDDTLHTPHIFPHIADVLSANTQILAETIAEKDSSVCESVKLTPADERELMKDVKLTAEKEDEDVLPDGMIGRAASVPKILHEQTSPQLSINGEEVQLLLKTADGKLMHLSAIPICDAVNAVNTAKQQTTVVIKTEPALRCAAKPETRKHVSRLSLAKMKLKQALTKAVGSQSQKSAENCERDGGSGDSKRENRSKAVDQVKKREILERNRASSMRARAKRKAWIQQLERTVSNVNETNVALQMEVKVLRTEVAKLKTLLLAHKDCPVTKAMQRGSGIVLGTKIISLNSELLTTPAPLSTAVKRTASFSTAEVPIVPKKKFSLTPSKNPIIFPKVDCATTVPIANTTLIKTLPTLKIMGVNQFLTEKEETKQILIVQNAQRKPTDTTQRQIVEINANEMENAASKSTGT